MLDGVGETVEEMVSRLDDDIEEDDGKGVDMDGVGEFGELLCKVDVELIMSGLDDDIEEDDRGAELDGVGESVKTKTLTASYLTK